MVTKLVRVFAMCVRVTCAIAITMFTQLYEQYRLQILHFCCTISLRKLNVFHSSQYVKFNRSEKSITCVACKFYNMNTKKLYYSLLLNVLSHIKYHTC